MDAPGKKETGSNIKKALQLRYSFNYNQELSRLMGVFSFYYTNGRFYRAFSNLDTAAHHVMEDALKRVFITTKDGINPDFELMGQFKKTLAEFRSLFGTGPSLDGKLSYLDLKPRAKIEPVEDRVFIPKPVRFVDVWYQYPATYAVFKIGYYYEVTRNIETPSGVFPLVEKIPSIDWSNPKIAALETNVMPYAVWEEQQRKVLNLLFPVAKRIELTIARYLHREGIEYSPIGSQLNAGGNGDLEFDEPETAQQEDENEAYDG